MSEKEILNRQQYKKNRKKWILIQTVALVVVAVIALGCFLTYNRLDRTYYPRYTRCSKYDQGDYTLRSNPKQLLLLLQGQQSG